MTGDPEVRAELDRLMELITWSLDEDSDRYFTEIEQLSADQARVVIVTALALFVPVTAQAIGFLQRHASEVTTDDLEEFADRSPDKVREGWQNAAPFFIAEFDAKAGVAK